MKRSFRWFFCTLLSCALLLGMLGSSEVLAAENLSGSCGQNLVWSFEPETGTLTIAGEGAIQDYESAERTPWAAYSAQIRNIVLLPGVTAIGKNAFAGCGVEKVVFPETLEIVGQNAFRGCRSLSELDLSGTRVRHIAAGAFVGCAKLTAEKVKLPQTIEYVDAEAFAEKEVPGAQADQSAETGESGQEKPAQQSAPAKSEEASAPVPVRTWTEEKRDGSILQLREMSDGTVQVDCYEDGELVYTSTRTYGEGGRVHEKKEYSDGDTVVEDRVEDADGNVLSSEAEYYEDGKLKYTQSTTYGEDGKAHAEIRYPNGSYSVNDWVEGPDGETLSLEQTVYDPDGNQVNRVVSRTEGDKSFLFVYDEGNNLFVEVECTEKPDGGYREIRKDYLPGTQTLYSTLETEVWLDANGEEIEKKVVETSVDGTFHQETVCRRNEDGTYTETSTMNRDGKVTTSVSELDKNKKNISSSSQTVDADGRVISEEEEIFHEDGSSTRTSWSLDSENKRTQVTEVISAENRKVSSADTIWNEKGEVIGGKDGFRLPDGNWWETQTQKNEEEGSQTIFAVVRDERGKMREQTEWRTGEKVINETLMRFDAEGDRDWVRTTTLTFGYDEKEKKWSFGRIAILDNLADKDKELVGESYGAVNEDGSMTVTIETDNGDGRTKRITYTLVRDEVTGEIRTDAVTSLLDGNGTAVESTRVTQNADGSFTRAVDNGILTEEFVYKDGTKLSHTRTIKATGERRETTFDEKGNPHTNVYDENSNLTDQVNALSLDEPMAVVMQPVAEEPVAEEPIAEEPTAEEPVAEEPIVEEPIAEEPIVEEPIAEEPIAEEPIAEEPVAEEPIAEEPIAEEPAAEEDPAAEEPQTESEASELPAEDRIAAVPAA